jgi:hypothetical protein
MVTACLAVALILAGAPPAQPETVTGLAVQYADGRRTVRPLTDHARLSWTPMFPRITGADTSRDGLPLFALQFEEAPERDGLAVTIALLYGRPDERRIAVDTVHLTGAAPVRVDALEPFGVRPVVLSLVPLPPANLHLPSVVSASSSLEITIDTVTDPAPAYHATIVNRSSRDVMMLAFTAYRGNQRSLTGRPRGQQHTALIPAGGSYVLKMGASAVPGRGAAAGGWVPLDRVDITSVLWSDGIVEGDAAPAADERALDAGTALQLDRIGAVLRAASANPATNDPATLRAAIASLTLAVTADEAKAAADAIPGPAGLPIPQVTSTMAAGMRNARGSVLNAIDELTQSGAVPPPAGYAEWLQRLTATYASWLVRLKS